MPKPLEDGGGAAEKGEAEGGGAARLQLNYEPRGGVDAPHSTLRWVNGSRESG